MVKKSVLACDRASCTRTDARRWVITPPGGQSEEVDLCPDHDKPARELHEMAHVRPVPMRESRLTRVLEGMVRVA